MLLVECTCTPGTCICIFYFININKVCVPFFYFVVYFGTLAHPRTFFLCTERSSLDFFCPNKLARPMRHGSPPISAAQQWSSSSRSCLIRYTSGGHDGAIFDAILGLRHLIIVQRWPLFWATYPIFFLVLYAGRR
jgi:hypothetical protein